MASSRAAQGNSLSRTRSTSKVTFNKLSSAGARARNVRETGAARNRRPDGARVERVAERVTEEVEAEYRGTDREPGKERRPGRVPKLAEVTAVGDHGAPTRRRRLHAEPEEGQRRLGDDGAGDAEGGGDDDRRKHTRQHVDNDDAKVSAAEGARRLNVLELPDDKDLTANEARHSGPADDA